MASVSLEGGGGTVPSSRGTCPWYPPVSTTYAYLRAAAKSAGVHSFLPIFKLKGTAKSVGVHSFLPIQCAGSKECLHTSIATLLGSIVLFYAHSAHLDCQYICE